jgi:hypothetical protein
VRASGTRVSELETVSRSYGEQSSL